MGIGLNLIKISTCEIIKLKFFGLVWGLWYLLTRVVKNLWNAGRAKSPTSGSAPVGNPPKCLTDASFGQHSYIKIKGVKLHYVDSGDKTKPLIILLHGFPDFWLSWRYQIPELSENFRVVALDLKGFGDSDKPESKRSYKIQNMVQEIAELVSTLGYRRCNIIGHDIGALIGWFVVNSNPDIVDKFVSIAAPHPNLYWDTIPSSSEINSKWVQFCQLPSLPENKALDDNLKFLSSIYSHIKNEDQSFLDAYRYSFSRQEDWIGAINYFRTLPYWRIKNKESYQVSALLIVGNKDSSVQMESVIKSCDFFEKFSIKVIDDAGHYPHQEKHIEINKILRNFLIGRQLRAVKHEVETNGLVNRVFGAVSSTVKYGNSVFETVQKTTNGITSRALYMGPKI